MYSEIVEAKFYSKVHRNQNCLVILIIYSAGDQTQGFMNALYHWATFPICFSNCDDYQQQKSLQILIQQNFTRRLWDGTTGNSICLYLSLAIWGQSPGPTEKWKASEYTQFPHLHTGTHQPAHTSHTTDFKLFDFQCVWSLKQEMN